MRPRLKIKEIAQSKGIGLTKLHNRSEVAYNIVREVWRNPYTGVTLLTVSRLAYALDVRTVDVIEDVEDDVAEAEIAALKPASNKGSQEPKEPKT